MLTRDLSRLIEKTSFFVRKIIILLTFLYIKKIVLALLIYLVHNLDLEPGRPSDIINGLSSLQILKGVLA